MNTRGHLSEILTSQLRGKAIGAPSDIYSARSLTAVALSFVVTLGALAFSPAAANAAEAADATVTIDGIVYSYDEQNVDAGATVVDYDVSHGNAVTIPSEIDGTSGSIAVRAIGDHAFRHKNIRSVVIPPSVVRIGEESFTHNQLTSVDIPNSVTHLGAWAFGYNRLETLVLPESLTEISDSAFTENKTLTSLNLPDSIAEIGDGAFASANLADLALPQGVKKIGYIAFAQNRELTKVTIPASVTSIDECAFMYTPSLTEVIFEGAPPADFAPQDRIDDESGISSGSLGDAPGLVVRYHARYDAATFAGGFTAPTWKAYNSRPLESVVTFDAQGGTPILPVEVEDGGLAVAPKTPTRNGYRFVGWTAGASTNEPFDFTAPITSDITLYAQWELVDSTPSPEPRPSTAPVASPEPILTTQPSQSAPEAGQTKSSYQPKESTLAVTGGSWSGTLATILSSLLALTGGILLLIRRRSSKAGPSVE